MIKASDYISVPDSMLVRLMTSVRSMAFNKEAKLVHLEEIYGDLQLTEDILWSNVQYEEIYTHLSFWSTQKESIMIMPLDSPVKVWKGDGFEIKRNCLTMITMQGLSYD